MAQVAVSRTADPVVIVLTGPECTGKSTLARELALELDASLALEFSRTYVARRGVALTAADVEPIARGQIAGEDRARRAMRHTLVKDTDLVSTVVYAHHYYGLCPAWIEQQAQHRLGHLYLLLAPDVPWVADGLQREGLDRREACHELFDRTLRSWRAHVAHIAGSWPERRVQARAAIATLVR